LLTIPSLLATLAESSHHSNLLSIVILGSQLI